MDDSHLILMILVALFFTLWLIEKSEKRYHQKQAEFLWRKYNKYVNDHLEEDSY